MKKALWEGFPHVLSANQFGPTFLRRELFPAADRMGEIARRGGSKDLTGKMLYLLFYETSTRTMTSFKQAARLLGATVDWTENARVFSSAVKGESLEDTVNILRNYFYDLIVLRYDETGGAVRAAQGSNTPIINAADGIGEHPTQALLDLYTIHQHFSQFQGLRVALVGDLFHSRTIHSLAYLLAKIGGVRLALVSPSVFRLDDGIKSLLVESGCQFWETDDLTKVASEVDVVYLTRLQKERLDEATRRHSWGAGDEICVCINEEVLAKLPKESVILHPLPRSDDFTELPREFDDDPRVKIFQQAQNGLFVRMALLNMILG